PAAPSDRLCRIPASLSAATGRRAASGETSRQIGPPLETPRAATAPPDATCRPQAGVRGDARTQVPAYPWPRVPAYPWTRVPAYARTRARGVRVQTRRKRPLPSVGGGAVRSGPGGGCPTQLGRPPWQSRYAVGVSGGRPPVVCDPGSATFPPPMPPGTAVCMTPFAPVAPTGFQRPKWMPTAIRNTVTALAR